MKIYIDVSMIMIGTKFTGIPRVVMELVKRFSKEEKIEVVPVEYDVKKDKYRIIDSAKFAEFCSTKSGNRNKLRTNDLIAFDEFEEGSIFFDSDTVWKTRVKRSFLYPVLKEKKVNADDVLAELSEKAHALYDDKTERCGESLEELENELTKI